jgi:uncharacterized phiE125 gp8 family phage protein
VIDVAYSLKTAAVLEPVTTADAKLHIRHSDDTTEDVLIDRCVTAARMWVEDYTGRSLLTQTWQLSASGFPYGYLWLPRAAPLAATTPITFVKYYDSDNALQTLATSVYTTVAFSEPGALVLQVDQSWPSVALRPDAVQVEYITGVASASLVPKPLTQAILLLAGHLYENREATVTGVVNKEIDFSMAALCGPYRVFDREWACAA